MTEPVWRRCFEGDKIQSPNAFRRRLESVNLSAFALTSARLIISHLALLLVEGVRHGTRIRRL